jgi:hypothetical protein
MKRCCRSAPGATAPQSSASTPGSVSHHRHVPASNSAGFDGDGVGKPQWEGARGWGEDGNLASKVDMMKPGDGDNGRGAGVADYGRRLAVSSGPHLLRLGGWGLHAVKMTPVKMIVLSQFNSHIIVI